MAWRETKRTTTMFGGVSPKIRQARSIGRCGFPEPIPKRGAPKKRHTQLTAVGTSPIQMNIKRRPRAQSTLASRSLNHPTACVTCTDFCFTMSVVPGWDTFETIGLLERPMTRLVHVGFNGFTSIQGLALARYSHLSHDLANQSTQNKQRLPHHLAFIYPGLL